MKKNIAFAEDDINVNKIVCYEQKWEKDKEYSLYTRLPRPNHGLTYVLAEYAVYTLPDKSNFTAKRGDIVYISQNSFYSVAFGKPDELGRSTYLINFSLDKSVKEGILKVVLHDSKSDHLADFAQTCELYKSLAGSSFALKAKVYKILDTLMLGMTFFSDGIGKRTQSTIERGVAYIENNIDKVFSIAELAEMCHMGESTFRREFSAVMGTSPLRYINFLKVEKAKELLANADFSISDLPETLGFYDLSHFYKAFKSVTGITPSRFRENLRKR